MEWAGTWQPPAPVSGGQFKTKCLSPASFGMAEPVAEWSNGP